MNRSQPELSIAQGHSEPSEIIEATVRAPWPRVGERWTDTSMMEVGWWRGLSWRVVTTAKSAERPTIRAWMLKPDDGPDGSWTDLTLGVVAVERGDSVLMGSWYTRGWVARSEQAELVVGYGPTFEDPPLVWVGERHSCDGRLAEGWAGNDYFFRAGGDRLGAVDELTAVDPSEGCAKSISTHFELDPPLRFILADGRYTHTFTFDTTTGSFRHTSLQRTVRGATVPR